MIRSLISRSRADRPMGTHWPAWMWASIAAIGAIDMIWLVATPLSLSSASVWTIARLVACVILLVVLARRVTDKPRLHALLTGGTMLLTAWPALRLYNHLTMTMPVPLADPLLARMDVAIGFDWLGYLQWLDGHPLLMKAMSLAYGGLTLYSVMLFLILAYAREAPERCAEFLKLFLITSIFCVSVGALFPALSAAIYYAPPPGTFELIPAQTGAYHLRALQDLRSQTDLVLDMQALPGLVTFPSFHTAMGVVAIWCARHNRTLLAASVVVNLTMIASTPLFGAHYGIDILAGALVAIFACFGLKRAEMHNRVPKSNEPEPFRLTGWPWRALTR